MNKQLVLLPVLAASMIAANPTQKQPCSKRTTQFKLEKLSQEFQKEVGSNGPHTMQYIMKKCLSKCSEGSVNACLDLSAVSGEMNHYSEATIALKMAELAGELNSQREVTDQIKEGPDLPSGLCYFLCKFLRPRSDGWERIQLMILRFINSKPFEIYSFSFTYL